MGYDISLWKWKKRKISPMLCDLLLSEDIPVSEVEKLNKDLLEVRLNHFFLI
jgi:hypothetical protein